MEKLYIQEIAYKRIGGDRPIVVKQTLIYTYTDTLVLREPRRQVGRIVHRSAHGPMAARVVNWNRSQCRKNP
jgi:hypothetical protein